MKSYKRCGLDARVEVQKTTRGMIVGVWLPQQDPVGGIAYVFSGRVYAASIKEAVETVMTFE